MATASGYGGPRQCSRTVRRRGGGVSDLQVFQDAGGFGDGLPSTMRRSSGEIPNYGERYRFGEPISTPTAEATVSQVISRRMVTKQQMRRSPRGTHLLLQVRTRGLNDGLNAGFARWYPGLASSAQRMDVAA